MAGNRYSLLFNAITPNVTFEDRFEYPLFNYVVPPPRETDPVPMYDMDFSESPYSTFIAIANPEDGDVVEAVLLNRRIQFQALRIEIVRPVEGLALQFSTRSGCMFDAIDCGRIGSAIYLPFGGVFEDGTSLQQTSFVIDEPDYIQFEIAGYGLSALHMKLTVMYSNTFDGLGLSNADMF